MAKRSPKPGVTLNKATAQVEHLGNCVICTEGIFSDQEYGRAPRPLLGKAHTRCGGA